MIKKEEIILSPDDIIELVKKEYKLTDDSKIEFILKKKRFRTGVCDGINTYSDVSTFSGLSIKREE